MRGVTSLDIPRDLNVGKHPARYSAAALDQARGVVLLPIAVSVLPDNVQGYSSGRRQRVSPISRISESFVGQSIGRAIELSNFGEIFLNPQLVSLLEYAYRRGVKVSAGNGVNLNTAILQALEAVVKFEVQFCPARSTGPAPRPTASIAFAGISMRSSPTFARSTPTSAPTAPNCLVSGGSSSSSATTNTSCLWRARWRRNSAWNFVLN